MVLISDVLKILQVSLFDGIQCDDIDELLIVIEYGGPIGNTEIHESHEQNFYDGFMIKLVLSLYEMKFQQQAPHFMQSGNVIHDMKWILMETVILYQGKK